MCLDWFTIIFNIFSMQSPYFTGRNKSLNWLFRSSQYDIYQSQEKRNSFEVHNFLPRRCTDEKQMRWTSPNKYMACSLPPISIPGISTYHLVTREKPGRASTYCYVLHCYQRNRKKVPWKNVISSLMLPVKTYVPI